MHISKISFNSTLYTQKNNKINSQNVTTAPIANLFKQVAMNDILFNYPVSFKGINSVSSSKISFDESLKKYFRFEPDKYQIESAKFLYNNDDTLVLAPTGTGKTLIAEYVINKNMDEGKTTYYTTPLKALSNEKYTDFCKLYGKENVGLLTGDIKINSQAPIVIMTTEIYRNMLMGEKKDDLDSRLDNVATVVYDEFHYMNDADRGEVWESSIMYTPPKVQQLLLSATAENGDVVQKWVNRLLTEKQAGRTAQIVNVPSDERHVPLKHYIYNPRVSKTSITPLMVERFSLKKLTKMSKPESKTQLTDKQREILSDISKRNGGNGSVEGGIETLYQITDENGDLSVLEYALIHRLNYPELEAQRAASILSNKAERVINSSLKSANTLSQKATKKAFYADVAPKKFIGAHKAAQLLIEPELKREARRGLMRLSYALKGDGSLEDGCKKINDLIGKSDMSIGDFKQKLTNLGLKKDFVDAISDELTIYKRPDVMPVEFDLINTLNKEDKLPAIFFNFSKKQCNNLRNKFLKTGQSLLNDEEKQKAAEIIKKHIEKGGFFGTGEDPATLLSGVALHHAGKMPAYKALVEELAQNKLLKVVFATSTLGAGINVPAKTVVFTQLTRYGGASGGSNGERFVTLSANEIAQMGGRAGRRGKDFIGNVIYIPDRDHGPQSIYNLVTAKPDAINSNFKPTYSFISHFIAQEGTDAHLADAVDKSFLRERLESLGLKPHKTINPLKKQFQSMAKVLLKPEVGCFEKIDGVYYPTVKGEVVAKARGVDGLLFAETLFNAGLQYLTPQEMAAVACALTSADERDLETTTVLAESVSDTLWGIDRIKEKIDTIQCMEKVNLPETQLNRPDAQYIYSWATAEGEDSRKAWEDVISKLSGNMNFNEGDFLKSVNQTIDVLEQIKEVSKFAAKEYSYADDSADIVEKMQKINQIATQALELLKRDPVSYEL